MYDLHATCARHTFLYMSAMPAGSGATHHNTDWDSHVRNVNAFAARMAGIDADTAAEIAQDASTAAEAARIVAEDARRAAQEAKTRSAQFTAAT